MTMFDNKFPLGLPEGSVRAILAVVLLVAAIAASFAGIESAPDFLWPAALMAVSWYFASRTAE